MYKYICVNCGRDFKTAEINEKYCYWCRYKGASIFTEKRECIACGSDLTGEHKSKKFCSKYCKGVYYRQINKINNKAIKTKKSNNKLKKHAKPIKIVKSIKPKKPIIIPSMKPHKPTDNSLNREINMWFVGGLTEKIKTNVRNRDKNKCVICGKTSNLHVHHIIPRVNSGTHTMDNLVTLCGGCHRSVESGDMEVAIKNCVRRALGNI